MADKNTYIPHPTDLSGVPETDLVKAFAEVLAQSNYEAVVRRAPRSVLGARSWESLSDADRQAYIDHAMVWAKFLDRRFGLDGLLGGDVVPPASIEEAVAREVHERKSARLMDNGWVWGEQTDLSGKKSPSLVPFDDLYFTEKFECNREGFVVNAALDDFMEIYDKGIGTVDDLIPGKSQRMSYGYAAVLEMMSGLRDSLERQLGWKSRSRHYDFTGVSGFYPVIAKDSCTIMNDGEPALTFYPKADGSVGMDVISEVFAPYRDLGALAVATDVCSGKYVLDAANLELLADETHHCREVIYGLRYGESAAFCIPVDNAGHEDVALMRELSSREPNLRIISGEMFSDTLEKWLEQAIRPGFEPAQMPVLMNYIFNGEKLFSEREVDLTTQRVVSPSESSDWRLVDELMAKGDALRHEFQRECGVNSGRLFRFGEAKYPSAFLRNDVLFLCSKYGAEQDWFLTATKGKIGLFKSVDKFLEGEEKPSKTFRSVDEAMTFVRSVVMSRENLMKGRGEYARYNKSNGIHP